MLSGNTRKFILTLMTTAVFLLSACASTEPGKQETSNAQQDTQQAATPQGPDADVVELYNGDGMLMPLDGSSLEAFNASLAKVERNTSTKSYTTLKNAIEYHLAYDLSVRQDRELLVKKLDGKTGYEIVEKVRWQKN
jgi:hypothetical protein